MDGHMHRSKTHSSTSRRVAASRSKARREGLMRLEVTVPQPDALFMRRAAETFRFGGIKAKKLRERMADIVESPVLKTGADFIAFLQRSPFAGVDLDLKRDRSVLPEPRFP